MIRTKLIFNNCEKQIYRKFTFVDGLNKGVVVLFLEIKTIGVEG